MKAVNLIFISSDWNLNHRKGLHIELNTRLGKWSEVVFVESPLSIIVHSFTKFNTRLIPFLTGKKNHEPVKKFTPLILFHNKIWQKIPITLKLDKWLIVIQLKRKLRKEYNNYDVIAWANFPYDFPIIELLKPKYLVYDFYDNYSYDANGQLNEMSDKLNRKLIQKSDIIFCTGKIMNEFSSLLNKNTWYVPNGHNLNMNTDIVKADYGIKGKVIGYIGNIRDWIDFDLINELLKLLRQNDYLVFIGPVEKNVSEIINKYKQNKQFIHIPAVKYSEIFRYIKTFDIGIIPFKVNRFTEGVLPYKFFEYIASDITIVTNPLPDLLQYKDVINVASDNNEFIQMCLSDKINLHKNLHEYEKIRKESLWTERAEFIENKLKELF